MKAYYYIMSTISKKTDFTLSIHAIWLGRLSKYKKTTDDDIFFSCLWNVKRFRVLHLFMSYKLHDIFRRQIVDVVYSVLYFCWHGSLHAFTVFVIVNVHKKRNILTFEFKLKFDAWTKETSNFKGKKKMLKNL